MQRSTSRIRTSHVGRLPPPKGWEDMPARLAAAEITSPATIASEARRRFAERSESRPRSASIASATASSGHRAASPITPRISPHRARPVAPGEPPTTRHSTRERDEFPDFYEDCDRAGTLFLVPGERPTPPVTVRVVARGPVPSI